MRVTNYRKGKTAIVIPLSLTYRLHNEDLNPVFLCIFSTDTSTAPSTPTTALIQSGQFGDDKGSGSGSESRLMAGTSEEFSQGKAERQQRSCMLSLSYCLHGFVDADCKPAFLCSSTETSTTPSTSTTILMPPKAPRVLTKSAPSESPEVDSPVEETIIQNRSFENQSTEGGNGTIPLPPNSCALKSPACWLFLSERFLSRCCFFNPPFRSRTAKSGRSCQRSITPGQREEHTR